LNSWTSMKRSMGEAVPCCIATWAAFHYVAATHFFRKNRNESA
jgi:hypothetical protein